MMSTFAFRVTVIVQSMLVILAVHTARACGEDPNGNALAMLPLSRDPVSGATVQRLETSVQWKDREYDVDAGIDVLMSVVRDPVQSAEERHRALLGLAMLGGNLKGRPCLDELATLYDNASEVHKGAILICFQGSDDPRGIPVFIRTLDKEQNMKLRLWAAGALAHWNIRRGAAELVKLLDSEEEMPQPSQLFYVRDNAMRTFRLKNICKGWGFPDDKESAEWPPDVMPPPDVAARLKPRPTVEEIKKWFAENERRFPDWKVGDPLPEVSAGDNNKAANE
jgi:hypothetical protein